MPVTFSSYRLGPGQRVSNKTVPPPWDWLLRRENELGPRRSRSQIIFAVLVPPFYVAVQAPALIVTAVLSTSMYHRNLRTYKVDQNEYKTKLITGSNKLVPKTIFHKRCLSFKTIFKTNFPHCPGIKNSLSFLKVSSFQRTICASFRQVLLFVYSIFSF